MTMFLEEAKERFAHFGQREALPCCWFSYERIVAAFVAACFAACFNLCVLSPEMFPALGTELPYKAFLLEEGEFVSFSWETF